METAIAPRSLCFFRNYENTNQIVSVRQVSNVKTKLGAAAHSEAANTTGTLKIGGGECAA